MKKTLLLLLFVTTSYCQEYYYDNCFTRDELGKFQSLNKSGYFEIENNDICLFDQYLKIQSTRLIFDDNSIYSGKMFTCTDGQFYYTFYLTKQDELFFYTREDEMIKFTLKLIRYEK
jgi:hypothetical protein